MVDFTHDPAATSWVESACGHADFPIQNLPLGVFAPPGASPRGGVAIGDEILDIGAVATLLDGTAAEAAALAGQQTLNTLLGAGNDALRTLRHGLFRLLTDSACRTAVSPALHRASDCALHLPVRIGDYTDFYSGIRHAENVGKLFRPDNPLMPNYKYVPIGYHGRSSSVRVSPGHVVRPLGQAWDPEAESPRFGPCRRLDYELEMAIWVGRGNDLGTPVPIGDAARHIAGISILNDWSARDIQAWEYQPLGPFLAKNFHTSLSAWVVTMDALAPFRVPQPSRPAGDPQPLPYLMNATDQTEGAFDITMEVYIATEQMRAAGEERHRLSQGKMTAMYWTAGQLLAHHSSNGCNLQAGDLLGTGTLSGSTDESKGSLIELTEGGKASLRLPNGEMRTFLEDGDEITITAFAERPGFHRIGFGDCRATVVSAP